MSATSPVRVGPLRNGVEGPHAGQLSGWQPTIHGRTPNEKHKKRAADARRH